MENEARKSDLLVVGMGASAGGLEAFFEFFDMMPVSSGMAFVLVTHLNPRQESNLTELISSHTKMKVQIATDGVRVLPDHVYVLPPDALLSMQGYTLRVIKAPPDRRMPIDHFLTSLAAETTGKSVGIVLSGTGSDGTLGLRAIKEHGGLTLAQMPGSAKFDSMPQNAIATGFVDHVLDVAEMPAKLIEYAEFRAQIIGPDAAGDGAPGLHKELEAYLAQIAELLSRNTGHDFSSYKKGTLFRRIERRMLVLHTPTVVAYVAVLRQNPQEVVALFNDLLIGVTCFFRDPDSFDALAREVIPKLFEKRTADELVRVWVPACSSGEEAYTLAILFHEYAAVHRPAIHIQIFATDIEGRALDTARRGRYPDGIANHVSHDRLARYFERVENAYQIVKHIRDTCVFSSHDLIRDPPFSRLDLISCRNLLIYLQPDLQKKIVPIFHYALRPGGFLFLGPSEDVPHQNELFVTVGDRKNRLFQRRETLRRTVTDLPLKVLNYPVPALNHEPKSKATRDAGLNRVLERIVLDQCTSACAFVDDKGEVLFQAGSTDRYLHRPPGPPSNNIIEIARKSIRLDLRAAIAESRRIQGTVVRENIHVETADGVQTVKLIVRPVTEVGMPAGLQLVRIQEVGTAKSLVEAQSDGGAPRTDEPAIQHLEDELKSTREKLEASVSDLELSNEDLRSSNEEVLSMNEELQSSNEELQTSKEELQSINEELETVNGELNQKVIALVKANNDSRNLFASTQLATVFLDRNLHIGKFTPAAKNLFNLIDTDVARPITDFAPRFVGANLVADCEQVLKNLIPLERPVESIDRKTWYMMRILPYRTIDDTIEGVVITFHDVTELRRAQQQRDAIIDSSQDAIISVAKDGTVTSWNPAARLMYGYTAEETIGQSISLITAANQAGILKSSFERIFSGQLVPAFDTVWVSKTRDKAHIHISLSPIHDENRKIVGVSCITSDISSRKRAESEARHSSNLLRVVIETATDGIITINEMGIIQTVNPAAERIFGSAAQLLHGTSYTRLISGSTKLLAEMAARSQPGFASEMEGIRSDGSRFPMEFSMTKASTDGSLVYTAFVRDITQRKLTEHALREAGILKESEERFHQLAELIPQIIWTSNAEGRIDFVNSNWLEFMGTTEAADHTWTWETSLFPDDAPAARKVWRASLESGQPFDCEMRLRRHDGVYRWHVARAKCSKDSAGKVMRWFGSCTDIDDQKSAHATLQSADRQKDEFLAVLGHELRNPLAPMRTAATILQNSLNDDPKLKRVCDIIQRQSTHMTRIIEDLLDISRISKRKIILRKETTDLNDLVQRTVDDYRGELEACGATLTFETLPDPVWILADPTRICQIVGNLLNNARKFTGDGGSVVVQLSELPDRKWAELVFRDTGVGMTEETMLSIFEPFKQADHSLARTQGGLGLGLAMVRALVELHGGTVSATSKGLGKGSEFTVRLPMEHHGKPAPKVVKAPPGKAVSRRVLIIEDNVDAAEMMKLLLTLHGHNVSVAFTGPSGLAAAQENRPDIVLCDIGLPGEMDGYAVAKSLRSNPALRAKTLVALTGYGQAVDQQRAKAAGFDLHIVKPVDSDQLINLVGSCPN